MPSLPLYPTDDGWPYPDTLVPEPAADDDVDLDLLELRVDPHAYADLTELEYFAVSWRYGLAGDATLDEGPRARSSAATTPRRARCSAARSTSCVSG